jgi:mRNA interferase RelE/StbE
MPYEILYSDRAAKDLASVDVTIAKRIKKKLETIKSNPYIYVKRLSGVELFSLRVGDYRVIMDIKNNKMIIFVVKMGHREELCCPELMSSR